MQGTKVPSSVDASQPLWSDVLAHGSERLGRLRRPHGAVVDPHKASLASVNRARLNAQTILGF